MTDKRKKIAVLIEAIRGHERSLLRGIAKYSRVKGDWVFYLDKLDPFYRNKSEKDGKLITKLLNWQVDGIITRYPDKVSDFQQKNIPVVLAIQTENDNRQLGTIEFDNREIGRMAAKHLMERGFVNFGFCGLEEMFWSKARCAGFSEEVLKRGYNVSSYEQPKSLSKLSWDIEQHAIVEWVSSLHRPVGIMACNDDRAEHVAEGCKQVGLNVPEDVAIIGVDNDEFVCEFADPPLSSIALNSEKAGFEVAEYLDEVMNGQNPAAVRTILVKPTHIVTRQSTDILAIDDEDVARALAYIRKNSRNMLQVEDIAEQVGISVRILQSRFQSVLGRTIRDELKKVRINEVMALLRDTNITVSQIAYQLGYSSDHNLARFFRAETGMSPVEYRRKFK